MENEMITIDDCDTHEMRIIKGKKWKLTMIVLML